MLVFLAELRGIFDLALYLLYCLYAGQMDSRGSVLVAASVLVALGIVIFFCRDHERTTQVEVAGGEKGAGEKGTIFWRSRKKSKHENRDIAMARHGIDHDREGILCVQATIIQLSNHLFDTVPY